MKKITIPTGYIIVDDYEKGQLETLSIGDYGKHRNIKAPFLGFNNDVDGVANGDVLPLSMKWVVTLSTQYGCPMKCTFCDVPTVGFNGNASFDDLYKQLLNALNSFPEVGYTDRLNIHFARMGEPTFNQSVLDFSMYLDSNRRELQERTGKRFETIHPVVSTMVPRRKGTFEYIYSWVNIKNHDYRGQAGLQISVNSTDEQQREQMFSGMACSLEHISNQLSSLPAPIGRKYCLNFALATGYKVDGQELARMFDPNKWMVKITPIHNNTSCRANGIETNGGYQSFTPYKKAEQSCQEAGFDTIVFIPSMDEEDGCVTCGNAILGDSELKLKRFEKR